MILNFEIQSTLKLNKMENDLFNSEKWYQSVTLKLVVLGFLGLLLLIPLEMIKGVIRDRAGNAESARKEISSSWAGSQVITGPVLNVPGTKLVSEDGKYVSTVLHILPDDLQVTGNLSPEKRYRGIYETVVYDSELHLSGTFTVTQYDGLNGFTYQWDKAYLTMGVSDNRGIRDEVSMAFGDSVIQAQPGTGQNDLFEKGITFPVKIDGASLDDLKGNFSLTLGLKGSESLTVAPVGKTTRVMLTSAWDAPSFTGSFLPAERKVSENGFEAAWVVTHLNRSFPQAWTGHQYIPSDEAFGVNLIIEADYYTRAERSAKYGILFIVITFFVLIITELRTKSRMHIFYYLLVAMALILFFSLLTALSEQIGFNAAYLVASASTIGLLSLFFRSLFENRWIVLIISGLLTVLYLFIFVLLALKDYAFLAGNIGLFILLAVLMLVSSRYKLFR